MTAMASKSRKLRSELSRIKAEFTQFGGETGGTVFGSLPRGDFFGRRAQEFVGRGMPEPQGLSRIDQFQPEFVADDAIVPDHFAERQRDCP